MTLGTKDNKEINGSIDEKNELRKKWLLGGDKCERREERSTTQPKAYLEKHCSKEEVHIGKAEEKIQTKQKDSVILEESKANDREQEMKKVMEKEHCWGFMNGYCRFASSCLRKHITRKEIECKYHNWGYCNKGNRCEYKHMRKQLCRRFVEWKMCFKKDICEFIHKDESDNTEDTKPISEQEEKIIVTETGNKDENKDFLGKTDIEQRIQKIENFMGDILIRIGDFVPVKESQS